MVMRETDAAAPLNESNQPNASLTNPIGPPIFAMGDFDCDALLPGELLDALRDLIVFEPIDDLAPLAQLPRHHDAG